MAISTEYRPPLAVIFLDAEGVLTDEQSPRTPGKTADSISSASFSYSNSPTNSPRVLSALNYCRELANNLDPGALENLRSLIKNVSLTIQVAIVITSSWRRGLSKEQLKEYVFGQCFFSELIIDKIPDPPHVSFIQFRYSSPRSSEYVSTSDHSLRKYGFDIRLKGRMIDFWLREHCESLNIHSFVIIDDINGDAFHSEIKARYPDRFVHVDSNKLFTRENAKKSIAILAIPFFRNFPSQETVNEARVKDLEEYESRPIDLNVLTVLKQSTSLPLTRSETPVTPETSTSADL